jgi:hypothetical protein
VLPQHSFFKRSTEQKLVCAKDSGASALRSNFYGMYFLLEISQVSLPPSNPPNTALISAENYPAAPMQFKLNGGSPR